MVKLFQDFVIKSGYIGNVLKYLAFRFFLLKDPEQLFRCLF